MKAVLQTAASVFLAIFLVLTTMAAVQGTDFFLYQYFGPRREEVRREVFEQSHAFRQGAIQELEQLRLDYVRSTPEQRSGIASLMLHRVAEIPDRNTLPPDLGGFLMCVEHSAPAYTEPCN